jgi:hypothetical protein
MLIAGQLMVWGVRLIFSALRACTVHGFASVNVQIEEVLRIEHA